MTTIELGTPVNIAGGKEGAERIERLEMTPLRAGLLWDYPATDLPARAVLTVGLRMAGYETAKAEKIGRALEGADLFAVSDHVNAQVVLFQKGAESAVQEDFDATVEHTIVLVEPLKLGSEELRELVLRPLKGKDVWDVPSSGATWGDMLSIGASQTGQADAVIRKLSAQDAGQLVGMVTAFLTAFRETGATS